MSEEREPVQNVPARLVDRDELRAQLIGLVQRRLLDPLDILLGSDAPGSARSAGSADDATTSVRDRVVVRADDWAGRLLGDDSAAATHTAARLIAVLYPDDAPFDPPAQWWGTPLGRIVALRIGHPSRHRVSLALAGAMLGITRQGVHDLVRRGKLIRDPEGGVLTSSVRDRLERLAADPAER